MFVQNLDECYLRTIWIGMSLGIGMGMSLKWHWNIDW